jgi:hypothetical protein
MVKKSGGKVGGISGVKKNKMVVLVAADSCVIPVSNQSMLKNFQGRINFVTD